MSTSELPPRQRIEAWREAAFRFMDAAPLGAAAAFSGRAVWRAAGGMEFWRYRSSAVQVRRDAARCRRDGADALVIMAMRRGSAILTHGSQSRVVANDVFLFDAAVPLSGHWNNHEEFHITVPRALVASRLGPMERHWAGLRFGSDDALGSLLSVYLRSLGERFTGLDDGVLDLAGRHIVDLAVRMLRAAGHPVAPSNSTQVQREMVLLLDCIEGQLADPQLCAAHLAAQLGWSLRKLYRIGEALPAGISATIAGCRLDRAHQDLRDPRLAHLRVGDIAGAWCFADLSHFSRAFRRRFGYAPSALRGDARDSGDEPKFETM